jgi:coenzyme PQQ synthesis protein D (PqqD)
MTIRPEDRVRRTLGAAWQELDGETVLLLSAEEKLLGLNRVAGRVWELSDGTRTVGSIVQTIHGEFEGTGPDAGAEILEFVSALAVRGLLEVVTP